MEVPDNVDNTFDATKILEKLRALGYRFTSVGNSYNKYWIVGKVVEGKLQHLVDGPKYYQLVLNYSDFGIQAGGHYNAWSFAERIKEEIKQSQKEAV
jgi:hypothetical protein